MSKTREIVKDNGSIVDKGPRMPAENITIAPANLATVEMKIVGTSPLVQAKFSTKAKEMMRATQEAGSTAKSKKPRQPKNFEQTFKDAAHVADPGGWYGIPAPAFRNSMISACRLVGYKMTIAKMSVFIEADGFDVDGMPLVKLECGEPTMHVAPVRNASGVIDLRARPMWKQWAATVRVTFDRDQFQLPDIANLLDRAGKQVGVGEGRHDSRQSAGLGWGAFRIANE